MDYPFTLHQDDNTKIVQLSGDYYTDFGCSINELKSVFRTSGSIELTRFKNHDDEVGRFTLSEQEADTFVDSWLTFKAEQELKKLAEEKRVAGIVEQARELLAGTSIILEEHPATETVTRHWTLRSDELEDVSRYIHNSDILLKYTQDAKAIYERHQKGKEQITEAFALVEGHPTLGIHGGPTSWLVDMERPNFHAWVHSPAELLEKVNQGKTRYERWQAELIRQQEDYSDIG